MLLSTSTTVALWALLPCLCLCVPALSLTNIHRLTKSKGMADVKAAGRYRQEGKTYEVADGDIIHFQFNVTTKKK